MSAQDDLRESRGRLDQATDNLLSDLQCPEHRFRYLIRDYVMAATEYAKALLAAKGGMNTELAEAYEDEAKYYANQFNHARLISILAAYRNRLGFDKLQGDTDDAP